MVETFLPFQCNHMEGLWTNTNKKNNTKSKRESGDRQKKEKEKKKKEEEEKEEGETAVEDEVSPATCVDNLLL